MRTKWLADGILVLGFLITAVAGFGPVSALIKQHDFAAALQQAGSANASGPDAQVLTIGKRLDAKVVQIGEGGVELGDPVTLSSAKTGGCQYVIVGAVDCPYSRSQALRWIITAANDPQGASMPKGWTASWVWVNGTGEPAEFFGPAFPVPRFQAVDPVDFVRQTGVTAFPSYLVLDAEGRIVSSGLGGGLLPFRSFLPDCFIDDNESFAEPESVTNVEAVNLGA